MERLSPHIWLFTSILRSIEKVLANKTEAEEKLRTTIDNQQPQDMLAWVKACKHFPKFEKLGERQWL